MVGPWCWDTGSWAGFLQGTYEVVSGQTVSRRRSIQLFLALAGVGVASTVTILFSPGNVVHRFLMGVGVRSLAAGLAFLLAGWGVAYAQRRTPGLGRPLICFSFIVYGLQQLVYFGASLQQAGSEEILTFLAYLSFADFLLQSMMGLGLVVWLLEEERQRVLNATAELEHLAYHDAMTGLPNRRLFLDRLGVALSFAQRAQGHKVGVLFLDLDRFKLINESLGHTVGDEVLRAISERLQWKVLPGDTVARLGDDEFALLLPGLHEVDDAERMARKHLRALRLPILSTKQELYVTASVGVAVYPDHGEDAASLLKNAEIAMVQMKKDSRNGSQVYSPTMDDKALELLSLESGIRQALVREEFVLHYQPIADAPTGRIVGAEALVRWQHPERGLLTPFAFLTVAENAGLMNPLGLWVLQRACKDLQLMRKKGFSDLWFAVNLSARHFQDPDLVLRVREALEATGLEQGDLTLEITESVAMRNPEATLGVLQQLKQLGVQIAIDDFGTGYSSLSYLKDLPVDKLKMDQSFVRHLSRADDEAISKAIITLAHCLKIRVVAEGVETEAQKGILEEQGCDLLQGYLLSRPVPFEKFEAFIRNNHEHLTQGAVLAANSSSP